jgi:hypothetical protein
VIAAGFRDVAGRKPAQRPSYLPKTWKAARDPEPQQEPIINQQVTPQPAAQRPPNVVQQVARNVSEVVQQVTRNVTEKNNEVPADDLDVPTFLRRQAQKA